MIYFPMPSFSETVERAARNMPAIRKYWIAPCAELIEAPYIQDDRWVRGIDFQHRPDWRATDGSRP